MNTVDRNRKLVVSVRTAEQFSALPRNENPALRIDFILILAYFTFLQHRASNVLIYTHRTW